MHIEELMKNDLADLMLKLIANFNCDIGQIIRLSNDKAYALVEQIYVNDIRYSYLVENLSRIINLNKSRPDTILDLVIKSQKQSVFRNDNIDNSRVPLIDNSSLEICIPIFKEEYEQSGSLIGCIYLGSLDIKNTSSINKISLEKSKHIIEEIQEVLIKINNKSERLNNLFDMMYIFLDILKSRDKLAINHSYNVAHWTKKICEKLNLSAELTEELYLAAILHDFGKVYDVDKIDRKKSFKRESGSNDLYLHSIYSYSIAKVILYNLHTIEDIPQVIKHHHDRFDGIDSVSNLKGEEIPLGSRILHISEYLDEMLTYGLNKKVTSINEILKELIRQKGKRFDPKLTDITINLLVNIRKSTSSILENPILWSTMTLYMIDQVVHLEGTIIRKNFGYIYKTDILEFFQDIRKEDIVKVSIYVENRNDVYEFSVKSFNIQNNIIYLSGLSSKPSTDSFSLLWELSGSIENVKDKMDVTIYKIGGHSLSFYVVENERLKQYRDEEVKETLTVSIAFEDSSTIRISGIITETYSIGGRHYFNLKYVNIPEGVRDEIFKRIFKKQIENRKLLNN